MGVWQSGQMRRAVNPLPIGYSGSNPLAPTIWRLICYLKQIKKKEEADLL